MSVLKEIKAYSYSVQRLTGPVPAWLFLPPEHCPRAPPSSAGIPARSATPPSLRPARQPRGRWSDSTKGTRWHGGCANELRSQTLHLGHNLPRHLATSHVELG